MKGWKYRIWNESSVYALIRHHRPSLLPTYDGLDLAILRVDMAKYLIADVFGGVVADLDIIPICLP
jgi:mannosyltransferase OCH1-like enzyme